MLEGVVINIAPQVAVSNLFTYLSTKHGAPEQAFETGRWTILQTFRRILKKLQIHRVRNMWWNEYE